MNGITILVAKPRRNLPVQDKGEAERPSVVPALSNLSNEIRTLVINVCLFVLVVIMVPVIGMQFLRSQVIIEAISVPPALVERGLSAEVAANRLWDGLHEVEVQAASNKEGISAIPKSQRVDFAIPDAGISIDALVYYVRDFFRASQTRVSGEFRCTDATCSPEGMSLRIRVLRDRLDIIQMPPIGAGDEAAYFRDAALRLLQVLDPYIAAAAQVDSNPEAAMALAERLVQTGSEDAKWAYNLLGNARRNRGDAAGAILAFDGALALDPDFVIAKTNKVGALIDSKDFVGAGALLDQVERGAGEDRFVAIARHQLALAEGDTDKAIAAALRADALDPGKPTYLFMAAQVALQAQRMEEAATYANRALAVAPDDYGAVFVMQALHQIAEQPDKALEVLEHALAIQPDQLDFLQMQASTLLQLKRPEESLVVVERALALAPASLDLQLGRASALLDLGRAEDALVQLDKAAVLEGESAKIALLQGQAHEGLGRKEAALAAYARAVTLDPEGGDGVMARMRSDLLARP